MPITYQENDIFIPYKDGLDIKNRFMFFIVETGYPIRIIIDIGRDSTYWIVYEPEKGAIFRLERLAAAPSVTCFPQQPSNGERVINIMRIDNRIAYRMRIVEELKQSELPKYREAILKINEIHERDNVD